MQVQLHHIVAVNVNDTPSTSSEFPGATNTRTEDRTDRTAGEELRAIQALRADIYRGSGSCSGSKSSYNYNRVDGNLNRFFNSNKRFLTPPDLYANVQDPSFRGRFVTLKDDHRDHDRDRSTNRRTDTEEIIYDISITSTNNAHGQKKASMDLDLLQDLGGGIRGAAVFDSDVDKVEKKEEDRDNGGDGGDNDNDDSIDKAIRKMVKESMDVFGVTGVSVGVIEKDQIAFSDGFGYADKERGVKATDKTHYHIASMSKAFTSMLLAIYADDPLVRLNLDVPVRSSDVFFDSLTNQSSALFPEWKLDNDEATQGTTLRDMLNHRTGLPRHDFCGSEIASSKVDLLHRLTGLQSDKPFRTMPGEYNNIMFALSGLASERLEASKTKTHQGNNSNSSSSSWEDLVQTKIFDVLNMTSTFPSLADFGPNRTTLARGYYQGHPLPEDANNLHHVGTPAGGIISNVDDMLKWAQLHLRQWTRLFEEKKDDNNKGGSDKNIGDGENDDKPYLVSNRVYMDNFVRSQTVFPLYSPMDTYSNGWWHTPLHGTGNMLMTHGGNLMGFSLAIGLIPDPFVGSHVMKQVGSSAIIVLTNENGSFARDSLLLKIADLLQERAGYRVASKAKIDWDQLFLEILRQSEAESEAYDKSIEDKIANTPPVGKVPLLDLDAYTGSYVDVKGSYGRFDVHSTECLGGKCLFLKVDDLPWEDDGTVEIGLGHMWFETFRFCDRDATSVRCDNGIQLTFENDGYGRVVGMKVEGLEPQVVLSFKKIDQEKSSSSATRTASYS